MNERAHNLTPKKLSPPVRIRIAFLTLFGSASAVAAREVEFGGVNQDTATDVVTAHGTYSIPGIEDPAWVSERTSGLGWDPRVLEALGQFFEDTEFVETDYYGPHRDLPDGEDKIWAGILCHGVPRILPDASGLLRVIITDGFWFILKGVVLLIHTLLWGLFR